MCWKDDETVRHYEVSTLEHDGTNAYLRVAPDRKRKFPIYVRLPADLAKMAITQVTLAERVQDLEEDVERLTYANKNLRATCDERLTRVNKQREEIGHALAAAHSTEDARAELERRLAELQAAFVDRGEELNNLRQVYNRAEDQRLWLAHNYGRLVLAVREFLGRDPVDGDAWKTAHTALANTLIREGYHTREVHPVWSRHFWFGCPDCVPAWLILGPKRLTSNREAAIAREIVKALDMEIAALLRPALRPEELAPRTRAAHVAGSEDMAAGTPAPQEPASA